MCLSDYINVLCVVGSLKGRYWLGVGVLRGVSILILKALYTYTLLLVQLPLLIPRVKESGVDG